MAKVVKKKEDLFNPGSVPVRRKKIQKDRNDSDGAVEGNYHEMPMRLRDQPAKTKGNTTSTK